MTLRRCKTGPWVLMYAYTITLFFSVVLLMHSTSFVNIHSIYVEKTHSFITSPQVHLSRPNISCLAFPRQQNQTVNTCTTDRYTIMPPQESPGLSLHLVCHFHHLMSFPFHHVKSVFAFLSFLCRIAFL